MVNLQPLAISNRKNMIIYSTVKSSYYITLNIQENSIVADQTIRSENTFDVFKFTTSPEVSNRRMSDLYPTNIPKLVNESNIHIKIFGVDPLDTETKSTMIQLIESRLSTLLQLTLSIYLSRNLIIKLTRPDIDFLLPIPKKPSRSEMIPISFGISNPYMLLMCLKQNLMAYLSILNLSDIASDLEKYLFDAFGPSEIPVM